MSNPCFKERRGYYITRQVLFAITFVLKVKQKIITEVSLNLLVSHG